MAKDWKPTISESPDVAARLHDLRDSQITYYTFRIGGREFQVSRGELGVMLFVGLFIGLVTAGVQTGFIRFPNPSPALTHYDAPPEVLLGSTENTQPGAGNPERNFLEGPGGPLGPRIAPAQPEAAAAEAAPVVEAEADVSASGDE